MWAGARQSYSACASGFRSDLATPKLRAYWASSVGVIAIFIIPSQFPARTALLAHQDIPGFPVRKRAHGSDLPHPKASRASAQHNHGMQNGLKPAWLSPIPIRRRADNDTKQRALSLGLPEPAPACE